MSDRTCVWGHDPTSQYLGATPCQEMPEPRWWERFNLWATRYCPTHRRYFKKV